MRLATVSVLFLLAGWTSVRAQALPCDNHHTPCEAYATADAIFTGKVIQISPETISIWQRDGDYDQIATVAIEKVYKGTASTRIILHQLGRNSSPKLVLNSSYLLYANLDRQTNKWEVRRCGRTLMTQYAEDDLRYLEGRSKTANQSRIAGAVIRYETTADLPVGETQRLAGVKIRIRGDTQQYEVVTGADGMYEIYGAPPGKYVIELEFPAGLTLFGVLHYGQFDLSKVRSLSIDLKERECSGATIILTPAKR